MLSWAVRLFDSKLSTSICWTPWQTPLCCSMLMKNYIFRLDYIDDATHFEKLQVPSSNPSSHTFRTFAWAHLVVARTFITTSC